MQGGKLRHKIKIEQVTEALTGSGAITPTWTTFATLRADVMPLNGREYFSAQQVAAENQVKFRIRFFDGITTKMRILFRGNYYDIHSIINPEMKNRELILMGVEYVD